MKFKHKCFALSMLLITSYATSSVVNAQSLSVGTTCQALAYLESNKETVTLKAKPSFFSTSIAQLMKHQYVCVEKLHQDWALVKKVKPLDGAVLSICDSEGGQCTQTGDFPAKPYKGKKDASCTLKQSFDAEDNIVISTEGQCLSGWVKQHSLHHFAD